MHRCARLDEGEHQAFDGFDHALAGGDLVVEGAEQLGNPLSLASRDGPHRHVAQDCLVEQGLPGSAAMIAQSAGLQRVIPIAGLRRLFGLAYQRVVGYPRIGIAVTHAAAIRSDTTEHDQWPAGIGPRRITDRAVGAVDGEPPVGHPRRRAAAGAKVEVLAERRRQHNRRTCRRTVASSRADSSSAASSSPVSRAIFT